VVLPSTYTSSDSSLFPSAPPPGKQRRRAFFLELGLLGAILLLGLLLRLWHLSALTDNYDEGVYWSSLRAMYAGNGLFSPVFSSQPPFFLLSLYPLVAVFGPTQVAARMGVVVLSLLGVLGMYLLARRLGGPWAGLGAAVLLACDYLYLLQSQTIDAEVPSVALLMLAVAAAAYADRYPWQAASLSGAATALAILEKLFAVAGLAAIAALWVTYLIAFERALPAMLQETSQRSSTAARWRLPHRQTIHRAAVLLGAYMIGLVVAGLLVFLPYLHQLQSVYQQVIAFHLVADQRYASTVSQNPQILLDATNEYPLAILALLGLLVGVLRRRWYLLTALVWMVAALAILLRQAPLFPRHLVLLAPALALSAALGLTPAAETLSAEARIISARLRRFDARWTTRTSKVFFIGLPVFLLAAYLLFNVQDFALYPLGPVKTAAHLSQIANDLQHLTTPQQQVITDDQYIAALADRNVPPELVDTSEVRITTGYLTTEQIIGIAEQPQIGAILFYTGRFDELPGWRDWVEQHFRLVRTYGNGQNLYLPIRPGP
jgi:hypothetical protein